jgi:hypothetical protein
LPQATVTLQWLHNGYSPEEIARDRTYPDRSTGQLKHFKPASIEIHIQQLFQLYAPVVLICHTEKSKRFAACGSLVSAH